MVLVGASSGIGRSIERQYAERGARVCIVGHREALVNEVEAECQNVLIHTIFILSSPLA